MNRYFPQRRHTDAYEKYLSSFKIREMQIKTTRRHFLTPVRT